ncbi:MAG: DMP19 family protein [Brevundimonas sp.]|uniref:DMP19 family protein n=1 Tax=Brevundimonas sp. TaxID=1871086 RepID=UPI00403367ED
MNLIGRLLGRKDAYWRLVDPYWETVSIYDGGERFLAEFGRIPEKSQHLLATHWCQSEVNNGGFEQFYSNSTGVLAPEAARGFRALGMSRCGAIVQEQLDAFGLEYPRDREQRQDFLQRLEDAHFDQFEDDSQADEPPPPLLTPRDSEFWTLLKTEAGGFRLAANRYAETQT